MYDRWSWRATGGWVAQLTASGKTIRLWEPIVPRVPEHLIRPVLYVYPSEDAALEDTRYGGTAFLLGVWGVEPTDWADEANPRSLYVVTAAHVVKGKGTRVLRINKHGGGWEPLSVNEGTWFLDDEKDLAILPVEADILEYDVTWFPAQRIITEEIFDKEGFGPGDDVVLIGRFREYGGKTRNFPSVRFGNISNLPHEDIQMQEGGSHPAFLVEMRSRGGFSGSPVFIFQSYLAGVPLDFRGLSERGEAIFGTLTAKSDPYLLGVDLGQYPTWLDVYNKPKGEPATKKNVRKNDALAIKELSAVTVVRPGWDLVNLLKRGDVMKPRRLKKQEWNRTPKAEFESEEPQSDLTRHEFEDTLRKVTRKVDPGTKKPDRR